MDPRFRGDDNVIPTVPFLVVIPAKAGIHRRHKRGTVQTSFLFVLDKIIGIRYYQSCMHIISGPQPEPLGCPWRKLI